MSTKSSSLINMMLTLGAVTLAAAISLGFVFKWTEGPIEAARIAKQLRAIEAVLGSYDNDPLLEEFKRPSEGDSLTFYPGKVQGVVSGYAIKTYSTKGYSGLIRLMVGLNPDGEIKNVVVLEHKETPGLGSKMGDEKFSGQFANRNPTKNTIMLSKDGGDIDAISGATISSRAFVEAVNLAANRFKELADEKGTDQ